MRDALFWTMTYLSGVDKSGSSRLERTNKFLDYYMPLQKELGFSRVAMLDNASPPELIGQVEWLKNSSIIKMTRFEEYQEYGKGLWYPCVWRAVYAIRDYILHANRRPKKLIFVDNDGFILSKGLATWVREQNSGWNALWCKRYNFPESSMQVLNEDCFDKFLDFTKGDFLEHCGKTMELVLPFTSVNKEFNSDRYGETGDPVEPGMDFYNQCPVNIPMKYGEW